MSTSTQTGGKSPSRSTPERAKAQQPHRAFSEPMQVVDDPALSRREKLTALASLEQDARQLATAAAEGMEGGEDTGLRAVLEAKRKLGPAAPAAGDEVEAAFSLVARTLDAWSRDLTGTEALGAITLAIEALGAARAAMARHAAAAPPPSGAPEPGSKQDMEEELEKEQLDP